jgi:hypothetical protein
VDVAMLGDVAQAWPANRPANVVPQLMPPLGLAWPEGASC